jgi:hypothetical protein
MITAWTKHLQDPAAKVAFERTVWSSKETLDRLVVLLAEMRSDLDNIETNVKVFENPNWSEKQAYYNGFKSALKTVTKLINLDQQNELINRPN